MFHWWQQSCTVGFHLISGQRASSCANKPSPSMAPQERPHGFASFRLGLGEQLATFHHAAATASDAHDVHFSQESHQAIVAHHICPDSGVLRRGGKLKKRNKKRNNHRLIRTTTPDDYKVKNPQTELETNCKHTCEHAGKHTSTTRSICTWIMSQ